MRARKYPNQIIDPVIYCDYYLLLEKIHKLYTDYEKTVLEQQLNQKDEQINQKDRLVLRLNEMLIDTTQLPKTQILYIATSQNYAQQNKFKVGGVESLDKLESRLSTYNSRSASGDDFYYSEWFLVHNYREIENRLKDLLGRFRDRKSKEIYVLHYNKLDYIVRYLTNHYNDEVDLVNEHLLDFISYLDEHILRPIVPLMEPLKKLEYRSVGHKDIIITGNSDSEIHTKLETYFKKLNENVKQISSKKVFDDVGIKTKRLILLPVLKNICDQIRPDVKIRRTG
jgi:hypothetical protein